MRALKDRNYGFAILSAQECVEFSLKGALKTLGIEYPWTHDAGWVLEKNKDRLPKNMLSRLDWLKDVSRRLAMKRSQAAYGDEKQGVPAGQLFERTDAATALRDSREVLTLCGETRARRMKGKREANPQKLQGLVSDWGVETSSDEIDQILYGARRSRRKR